MPFTRLTQRKLSAMSRLALPVAFVLLIGLTLAVNPINTLADSNQSSVTPTLPPAHFSPSSHLEPRSASFLLGRMNTYLGPTELVAFRANLGLCLEIDHIPPRSRAGGCLAAPIAMSSVFATIAWGYSSAAGRPGGTTELLLKAIPSLRGVRATFQTPGGWHRAPIIFAEIVAPTLTPLRVKPMDFVAVDLPGCIESPRVRLRALFAHHRSRVFAPEFHQRAACDSGSGYVFHGPVAYGALPSS
jgi:hypothetical protein